MSDASPLAAPRRAPHGEASARTLEQASGQPGARSARGSRPFRPWRHLVAVALLAALHLLLLHLMAEEQTVAKLFAAGALDLGSLLVAAFFLAVRLTLLLFGPGLVLYGLLGSLWAWKKSRSSASSRRAAGSSAKGASSRGPASR
ncbi:MAG TPA: hypothetical protein RMH85_09405 [Polyangiaceae bacterium LLY-WYZ-15_(1-7)]|nr:hypothetical protein [Polyangiaceae bacterium LLY-WYZ-15_(1-7)]HJL08703.1 hypothetical protein [Polyangiaceae bacterium LLY-WYZ-15_(1-7)]HJL24690.1 hypothetical protein [Polyangiaceae bacterium LLY-WYZ-15_(1-7)]HJL30410.1 hypothetical protein [Polyangiaceae bacterium LLY-WYZ-15_(1-7)]HJL50756.1 hypothetical protein [Polyangiaceae bacterium LLY-WYZ-15_(1-7)]